MKHVNWFRDWGNIYRKVFPTVLNGDCSDAKSPLFLSVTVPTWAVRSCRFYVAFMLEIVALNFFFPFLNSIVLALAKTFLV